MANTNEVEHILEKAHVDLTAFKSNTSNAPPTDIFIVALDVVNSLRQATRAQAQANDDENSRLAIEARRLRQERQELESDLLSFSTERQKLDESWSKLRTEQDKLQQRRQDADRSTQADAIRDLKQALMDSLSASQNAIADSITTRMQTDAQDRDQRLDALAASMTEGFAKTLTSLDVGAAQQALVTHIDTDMQNRDQRLDALKASVTTDLDNMAKGLDKKLDSFKADVQTAVQASTQSVSNDLRRVETATGTRHQAQGIASQVEVIRGQIDHLGTVVTENDRKLASEIDEVTSKVGDLFVKIHDVEGVGAHSLEEAEDLRKTVENISSRLPKWLGDMKDVLMSKIVESHAVTQDQAATAAQSQLSGFEASLMPKIEEVLRSIKSDTKSGVKLGETVAAMSQAIEALEETSLSQDDDLKAIQSGVGHLVGFLEGIYRAHETMRSVRESTPSLVEELGPRAAFVVATSEALLGGAGDAAAAAAAAGGSEQISAQEPSSSTAAAAGDASAPGSAERHYSRRGLRGQKRSMISRAGGSDVEDTKWEILVGDLRTILGRIRFSMGESTADPLEVLVLIAPLLAREDAQKRLTDYLEGGRMGMSMCLPGICRVGHQDMRLIDRCFCASKTNEQGQKKCLCIEKLKDRPYAAVKLSFDLFDEVD